jgi:hypothetical protein
MCHLSKACMSYVVALLDWAPTLEWSMRMLIVKNGTHKDTCHVESGQYAQIIDTQISLISSFFVFLQI